MNKFLYIAVIFFAGHFFGDSAIRIAKVAYAEVAQVVKIKMDQVTR